MNEYQIKAARLHIHEKELKIVMASTRANQYTLLSAWSMYPHEEALHKNCKIIIKNNKTQSLNKHFLNQPKWYLDAHIQFGHEILILFSTDGCFNNIFVNIMAFIIRACIYLICPWLTLNIQLVLQLLSSWLVFLLLG